MQLKLKKISDIKSKRKTTGNWQKMGHPKLNGITNPQEEE
jgi:hypothetical protein